MAHFKVSIITVCLNSEKTIRETIESTLNQNYPNIEYIVVDGASHDRTLEIVEEYKKGIAKIISASDRGIYDAINKGIHLATGAIVGILNADDVYQCSDSIASVVNHFEENKTSDIVFGDVVFVKKDDIGRITRYYAVGFFQPWMLRFGWMPPHPATFIKRDIFHKYGLYSTDYKISADYELFVRLFLINRLRYTHLDEVLVRMKIGGISNHTLYSRIMLNSEIVKACRTNGIYTNLFFVLSKTPLKLLELIRKPKTRTRSIRE